VSRDAPEHNRVVPAHAEGERLDRFLRTEFPRAGRAAIEHWILVGGVTLNGRRAAKSTRLAAGDVVVLRTDPSGAPEAEAEAPLTIVLERPDLVVVDKPAGQATAPLVPDERGTLCGALLSQFPEMYGIGYSPREPGILHRLDTDTSGLVLAARTAAAFDLLRGALTRGALHKTYLGLVLEAGLPERTLIETALGPGSGGRVVVLEPPEHAANLRRSEVHTRLRVPPLALVEVSAPRAYRHQVRVHLAALGFPLLGDSLYGGSPWSNLSRHALHAHQLSFEGESGLAPFAVQAALPADFREIMEKAGAELSLAGWG
jgi:23S rRNA pseudouridine1911/1915/1917 synthase